MASIIVTQLGKRYAIYHKQRPTTFVEAFKQKWRHLRPLETFWALREVTFDVQPGEMVGLIGANGAGKSSLLRLLGGVGKPDEGSITSTGRIGAIFDLGTGFHPDLTGRENIFVSGIISGLSKSTVKARFDDIVAFAEAESFVDHPLRTYSSGMQMRLAFSVAVHINPDILLIDEVLAVGDIAFQRKCLDRILSFKDQDCAIILVSHDIGLVEKLCDRAIWLKAGRIAARGPAPDVVLQFRGEMEAETKRRTPQEAPSWIEHNGTELRINENRFGSLEMEISSVRLLNEGDEPIAEINSGQSLIVEMILHSKQHLPAPHASVTITTKDGLICFDTNSAISNTMLPDVQGTSTLRLLLERLDLAPGDYFVNTGIYTQDWTYSYDYHWHTYPLRINGLRHHKGIMVIPQHWSVQKEKYPTE